eukprot:SAG31_NODE_99_length_25388_cov_12.710507_5_plen_150_part_00
MTTTDAALWFLDIRIGFPSQYFIYHTVPAAVRNDPTLAKAFGVEKLRTAGEKPNGKNIDHAASPHLIAKVSAAKAALVAGGFATSDAEWDFVQSDALPEPVNALYAMVYGFHTGPGQPFAPWGSTLSTLTGQMAAWMDQYLEPSDVTIR